MSIMFDEVTHTYRKDGIIVPHVTQVLRDLIPGWSASEWYLERGVAVHACAAMVAKHVEFDYDTQIDGQVKAIRRFFDEVKPEVLDVEKLIVSEAYAYAGRLDLICRIGIRTVVLDWKASVNPSVPYQLSAYALPININYGVSVELHDDGTYKMSEIYDLRKYKNGWLALLSAYNIRRKCGVKEMENGTM